MALLPLVVALWGGAALGAPERSPNTPRNLRAHVGVDAIARLTSSSDLETKLRGVARAAASGAPEAALLLAQLARGEAGAGGSGRLRLELARALAPFADQTPARDALLALMAAPSPAVGGATGTGPRGAPALPRDDDESPRLALARVTAALALASSPEGRGRDGLLAAVRFGGPGALAAAAALRIHPPEETVASPPATATGGGANPSALVIELLSDLGDLRGLDTVRAGLRAPDVGTRIVALRAAGRLGDGRAAPIVEGARADNDPAIRVAAAEALLELAPGEAEGVVVALLATPTTALAGARLAERARGPTMVAALASHIAASADPLSRGLAVVALGRQPTADAPRVLADLVSDPLLGGDCAAALAHSQAPGVGSLLARLATTPATQGLALRAYALARGAGLPREAALEEILRRLVSSADGGTRALGLGLRVAMGDDVPLSEILADADPRVRRIAAARFLALGRRQGDGELLLERSRGEPDERTAVVLRIGLVHGDPHGWISTPLLAARVAAGDGDAYLAAMAYAARGPDGQEARVQGWLGSRDPLLRAHVARGLASSPWPMATGLLADAYTFEVDEGVRRAVVSALARRIRDGGAPLRLRTLTVAARLDPDGTVRTLARRALAQQPPLDDEGAPRDVVWLRLVARGDAPLGGRSGALLEDTAGLALPVIFDDGGHALVPGITAGSARLTLAPRPGPYEPPAP